VVTSLHDSTRDLITSLSSVLLRAAAGRTAARDMQLCAAVVVRQGVGRERCKYNVSVCRSDQGFGDL